MHQAAPSRPDDSPGTRGCLDGGILWETGPYEVEATP